MDRQAAVKRIQQLKTQYANERVVLEKSLEEAQAAIVAAEKRKKVAVSNADGEAEYLAAVETIAREEARITFIKGRLQVLDKRMLIDDEEYEELETTLYSAFVASYREKCKELKAALETVAKIGDEADLIRQTANEEIQDLWQTLHQRTGAFPKRFDNLCAIQAANAARTKLEGLKMTGIIV